MENGIPPYFPGRQSERKGMGSLDPSFLSGSPSMRLSAFGSDWDRWDILLDRFETDLEKWITDWLRGASDEAEIGTFAPLQLLLSQMTALISADPRINRDKLLVAERLMHVAAATYEVRFEHFAELLSASAGQPLPRPRRVKPAPVRAQWSPAVRFWEAVDADIPDDDVGAASKRVGSAGNELRRSSPRTVRDLADLARVVAQIGLWQVDCDVALSEHPSDWYAVSSIWHHVVRTMSEGELIRAVGGRENLLRDVGLAPLRDPAVVAAWLFSISTPEDQTKLFWHAAKIQGQGLN